MLNQKLKMSNGAEIESIEELRENADAVLLLGSFFKGTLINWCKEYHYNKEAEELFELNNNLVRWICSIFNIEYTDNMPIDDLKELADYLKNNNSFHVRNDIEKNLVSYTGDKPEFQRYEVEIKPTDYEENTLTNAEVTVYNILTEVKLNCIIPFGQGEKELFDKIISLIHKVEEIKQFCSLRFSGSGGYGYGLELI